METNTLSLELSTWTGANQRVESGNSSDNQGRSNSSNISSNGHDKLIQAEAVDPIINEGNSSSSHKPGNMETNTFPFELLTNNNYADWSVEMKNKLLAQGLWDIVETGLKPLKPDDDEVKYEARRKMNDEALHAIQSSCGMDILSRINNISSSKDAWKMLGKIPMESNGHDKQIQIEYDNSIIDEGSPSSSNNPGNMETNTFPPELLTNDNSIIDEGNPSSSDNPGPERVDYGELLKAVRRGDWNAIREFLERHPEALTATNTKFDGRGTVLHAAVDAEQDDIVEELVNMIPEHDLAIQDDFGYTALHICGNRRVAECLIRRDPRLVSIRNNDNILPVALAMHDGCKELARYLYSRTPLEALEADHGFNGALLLNSCFYRGELDMALRLMVRRPGLAFASDGKHTPLEALAVSTEAFETGKGMVFWKQWIYNHCIPDISLCPADQVSSNIPNHGREKNIGSVRPDDLWHQLVSTLSNLLGFERLYEMKLVRAQFQQLMSDMGEEVEKDPDHLYLIMEAMFGAIKRGNFEFVHQIVKANSYLLWKCDADQRHIFHLAVLHRQHRIFSLIYSLSKRTILKVLPADCSKNTMLHLAGKLTENTPIDQIRGAALQMQREVQWFKEVERISPLSDKEKLNNENLTPKQLFTRDHKEMRKEGEKWMKDTATSCTVVGALIITVMFAAAFTIPGGNDQTTGFPILVHYKLFKLFMVADFLALFSSSTSVLMFLGILTSRYAEEDFLTSLPRKMIIGLFTLFFSIATMMIAFSAALLLMLRGKYQVVAPIIGLASVPIVLFVFVQFRLLVDMFVSTYRPGIFDRKMKPWI